MRRWPTTWASPSPRPMRCSRSRMINWRRSTDLLCHARESGHPGLGMVLAEKCIPAFAGMTNFSSEKALQHIECSFDALEPHFIPPDIAKAAFAVQGGLAGARCRDMHQPDRLFLGAAAGTGDARDGQRKLGGGIADGAFGHRARHRFGDRAMLAD